MPELLFRIRWPDGRTGECVSPSRAMARFLEAGAEYGLADFLRRSREGLHAASERVREVYGSPCARAAAQLAAIEREAAGQAEGGTVAILSVTQRSGGAG